MQRYVILFFMIVHESSAEDMDTVLNCHRRIYNHTVVKKDAFGKSCWDTIPTISCWGRCDSHEMPDWKFPFKKSHHPVCIHDMREVTRVVLKNCESNVQPGTEIFEYHAARSCKCTMCKSSMASCENIRQKENNFHPYVMQNE